MNVYKLQVYVQKITFQPYFGAKQGVYFFHFFMVTLYDKKCKLGLENSVQLINKGLCLLTTDQSRVLKQLTVIILAHP